MLYKGKIRKQKQKDYTCQGRKTIRGRKRYTIYEYKGERGQERGSE